MHAQMSILRDIIYGAVARGADLKKVCAALEIDPNHLNDSERLVPFKPSAEVWDVTLLHTGDALLGLHLGEEIGPSILGMIGYTMQSSRTLYEALASLEKFNSLHSTMLKYVLRESDQMLIIHFEAAIQWQHQYPESLRQSIEMAMSGILAIFRILSGKKIFPLKVELAYPVRSIQEYERVFQSVIGFNADRNALVFSMKSLTTPVISYDRSLFAFFNNTLEQKLQALGSSKPFSAKITQMIITDFKGRLPSIEIAASHLNMTTRSLQRKLKEEQTSYRQVTNAFKKKLAETILNRQDFRIGEVANILGYSDSSAFRKALKKWNTAPES